jgi:hypothetical protein
VILAARDIMAGKEGKNERQGKGERKTEEVQDEHLKTKTISFIHECLSALCNRLWHILEI